MLSYDSRSRPSCILWEDLFSFFAGIPFSRPLLKDKPSLGSGKAGWQIITICQRPRYSKQHELCLEKRILCKTGHTSQKEVCYWKKSGSSRASVGLMASLKDFSFYAPDFIPNSLLFTCQRKRMLRCRPGCTCKMFPISFLLFVPVFNPLVLCKRWVRTEERAWTRGTAGTTFGLVEILFFFCPVEENWKKLSWRDEIISWRQMIMNQGVVVNQLVIRKACYLQRHCQ